MGSDSAALAGPPRAAALRHRSGRGRRAAWRGALLLLLGTAALAGSPAARAHAFGARYDLPLPLLFYLAAAGAAVLLTVLALALWSRPPSRPRRRQWVLPRCLQEGAPRLLRPLAAGLGVAAYLLVLAAGLFGVDSPTQNIAPVLVWVLWWVGLLFFCALVGNAWPLLDPWSTLYRLGRGLAVRGRAETAEPEAGTRPGGWFAALLFLLFAWLELVSPLAESPRGLALLVLGYSLLAWSGMALRGRRTWLVRVDPFHRVFGIFGRFAMLGRDDAGRLVLRLPGAGLLGRHPAGAGDVVFILLVLAAVAFDGAAETPLWQGLLDWLAGSQTLRPLLLWLAAAGIEPLAAARSLGLVATAGLFWLVFATACWLAARAGGGGVTAAQAMRRFALSLLPIALAYHLAHYLSFLLLAGQLAMPLASDPLGLGWDLLGTSGWQLDLGVISARGAWYVAVAVILAGHMISVALAHLEALDLFPSRRAALASQLPMALLMIAFTLCSLWILAQPLVREPPA
jgi:hypothetical protein